MPGKSESRECRREEKKEGGDMKRNSSYKQLGQKQEANSISIFGLQFDPECTSMQSMVIVLVVLFPFEKDGGF